MFDHRIYIVENKNAALNRGPVQSGCAKPGSECIGKEGNYNINGSEYYISTFLINSLVLIKSLP